ncbi:hypothetical protein CABS03_06584 [Colletotrichum abscissum]
MTQNPARCFKTRKDGLINKAHVLHNLLPDAKVAMFALYDGNIYSYQSHENWPLNPFEIGGGTALPDDQKLPGHFVTIKFTRDSPSSHISGTIWTHEEYRLRNTTRIESYNASIQHLQASTYAIVHSLHADTFHSSDGKHESAFFSRPPGNAFAAVSDDSQVLDRERKCCSRWRFSVDENRLELQRVAETIKTVGYVKHERLLQSLHAHTFRRGEEDRQESRNV